MVIPWLRAKTSCTDYSIRFIQVVVAFIIIMHPLHGFFYPNSIPRFGEYLSSLGFPFGLVLAWTVLITQVICSLGLLLNRFVILSCIGHIIILSVGIWVFHAPNGWFIVGPGTGGVEFSVLMIACLVAVFYSHLPE